MNKEYLGDSVYAAYESGYIQLTLENGKPDDPSATILLDGCVMKNFDRWRKKLDEDIEKFNAEKS